MLPMGGLPLRPTVGPGMVSEGNVTAAQGPLPWVPLVVATRGSEALLLQQRL